MRSALTRKAARCAGINRVHWARRRNAGMAWTEETAVNCKAELIDYRRDRPKLNLDALAAMRPDCSAPEIAEGRRLVSLRSQQKT